MKSVEACLDEIVLFARSARAQWHASLCLSQISQVACPASRLSSCTAHVPRQIGRMLPVPTLTPKCLDSDRPVSLMLSKRNGGMLHSLRCRYIFDNDLLIMMLLQRGRRLDYCLDIPIMVDMVLAEPWSLVGTVVLDLRVRWWAIDWLGLTSCSNVPSYIGLECGLRRWRARTAESKGGR